MSLLKLLRICFLVEIVKHKAKLHRMGIELVTMVEKGLFFRMRIETSLSKKYLVFYLRIIQIGLYLGI